jgi:hypothetical protein
MAKKRIDEEGERKGGEEENTGKATENKVGKMKSCVKGRHERTAERKVKKRGEGGANRRREEGISNGTTSTRQGNAKEIEPRGLDSSHHLPLICPKFPSL